jgi:[ribosomal protein S5]-alanine N-acetyltransferase
MIVVLDRYILAPLGAADEQLVVDLWQDVSVRQHLGGIVSLPQIKARFEAMVNPDHHSLFYTIKDKDDQVAIGLLSIDDYHDTAKKELSYQLLPAYWGQNIAFACIKAFLTFSLPTLQLEKVYAETQSANTRSVKLLKRLGMQEYQRLIRFGAEQSVYVYKDI